MTAKLDEYPKTDDFECVDTIGVPHSYTITAKHVAIASDHFQGRLGEEAVVEAEKRGARCGMKGCSMPYQDHQTAIVVKVKTGEEIEEVKEGLTEYLISIKEQAEKDGFAGFVFTK